MGKHEQRTALSVSLGLLFMLLLGLTSRENAKSSRNANYLASKLD